MQWILVLNVIVCVLWQDNLLQLHRNLKIQLELLKKKRGERTQQGEQPWADGWVVVPNPT